MSAVFLGLLGIADVRGWSMTADGLRVIRHPWSRLFATMCLNRRFATFNLVDYYCAMTDELAQTRRLRYDVSPAADARAAEVLGELGIGCEQRFVALQLGASRAIRQWPEASFVGARPRAGGRGLARRASSAAAATARSATGSSAAIGEAAVNTCGKTGVGELGAVLRRAAALVTGDTGSDAHGGRGRARRSSGSSSDRPRRSTRVRTARTTS